MSETISTIESPPAMKICSACKIAKDANRENFVADKRNRDGFQARCRSCENARRRVDAKIIEPVRQAFADEDAYQKAVDWYRLTLDKAASERVLADPKAKFTKRDAARLSLERTLAVMRKARPGAFKTDGSLVVAPAVDAPAASTGKRPFAETHPFKPRHREGSAEYGAEYNEWVNLCALLDGAPASTPAPVVEQPQTVASNSSSSPTINAPTAVVVPYAETLPAFVPPPEFDIVFMLEEDNFYFYSDLTEAKPPFPLGAKFVRAPLPPGYTPGDRQISPHYRYDRMSTSWWRI